MKILRLFNFLSNESQRELWAKKQILKILTGKSILDVGAGQGRFKKYCLNLNYVSQDFGKYNGKGDGVGLQTEEWDSTGVDIISDIIKIPLKDASFDNVLCTAVLEHILYPELAIKEISRILKKGGRLILDAPFCSQTHFSPYFFTTGFSPNWYRSILQKYGFKILLLKPYGNYFDYLAQELFRLPKVFRKYSNLPFIGLFLYPLVIPFILVVEMLSIFSRGSEKQLCFGHHVLAKKI